jgi:hypothetical protein
MTKEHTGHKTDDGDREVDSRTWVLAECDRFDHDVTSSLRVVVCSPICGMDDG